MHATRSDEPIAKSQQCHPWRLLVSCIAVAIASSVAQVLLSKYFAFSAINALYSIILGLVHCMNLAVLWWLVMLGRHSLVSVLVPVFWLLIPLALGLWVGSGTSSYYGTYYVSIGMIVYLFSRVHGLQLVRSGEEPFHRPLSIGGILLLTTIAAITLGVGQVTHRQESPGLFAVRYEIIALVSSVSGCLPWILLPLCFAKRSWILIAVALIGLTIVSTLSHQMMVQVLWSKQRVLLLDLISTVGIIFVGMLLTVFAIWLIGRCGYRLARSSQEHYY